jgi:hypothetical protein
MPDPQIDALWIAMWLRGNAQKGHALVMPGLGIRVGDIVRLNEDTELRTGAAFVITNERTGEQFEVIIRHS